MTAVRDCKQSRNSADPNQRQRICCVFVTEATFMRPRNLTFEAWTSCPLMSHDT